MQQPNAKPNHLPEGFYYQQKALSAQKSLDLFYFLQQHLNWQQPNITVFGKTHPIPRLQCFIADEQINYTYSDTQLVGEPWPEVLDAMRKRLSQQLRIPFNALLVNLYRDGQDCMGWHSDDEKELGVCMVDIGGGTTDISIYTEGSIRHTAVIPIAGDQVTNDIAMALRTPTQNAEDIKIKYACALTQLAGADETIKVPSVGDRPHRDLSRQALAEVVEPRYDELFTLVQAELRRSGFEDLVAAGVVLTGGSAKIEGAIELAEEIFHMPVRLGAPNCTTGLADVVRNPIYSTGVGLLQYGLKHQQGGRVQRQKSENISGIMDRVKHWVRGNF